MIKTTVLLLIVSLSFAIYFATVSLAEPGPASCWTQANFDWKQAGAANVPGPAHNSSFLNLFSSRFGLMSAGPVISPKTGDVIFAFADAILSVHPVTGKISWQHIHTGHKGKVVFSHLAIDSKGEIYAASDVMPFVGWVLVELSPRGKLEHSITMPYVYSKPQLNYPLILLAPDDTLLVLNATSLFSANTCRITSWFGPILGPCYDGLPMSMSDSGWLFTLETAMNSTKINAYESLLKRNPSWSYQLVADFDSFATVWTDQNLLLVTSPSINTLNALALQSGSVVWQFHYANFAAGIRISPLGYALLYPRYDVGYTYQISPDGGLISKLDISPIHAVDSNGNLFGFKGKQIAAYTGNGDTLWEDECVDAPFSIAIGNGRTLYVMTPNNLTAVIEWF